MKTKTCLKNIFILAFSCYFSINTALYAQITIGLDGPPIAGALLQLKSSENNSHNAQKGLGLPRVNLTERYNLFPMFEADGSDYKIGSTSYIKADEDNKHIGLMVYNVNTCLNKIADSNGPHVWDGNEWTHLRSEIMDSNVKKFTDGRDGEVYTYRRFGEAGIWMIENLRAKRLPNGEDDIPLYDAQHDDENPSIGYPSTGAGNKPWKDPQYYNQNPKLGILYNWYAATNTTEATSIGNVDQSQETPLGGAIGQNEVENLGPDSDSSNPSVKFIQGICPEGWHLPSDREWNLLERYIYQNAEQFSRYTAEDVLQWNATTPWDNNWEFGLTAASLNWRGVPDGKGHAYAMMAPCSYYGPTPGVSKASWNGGFCSLLSGVVWSGYSFYFGSGTAFWTSSSGPEGTGGAAILNAWYRMILYADSRGIRVLRSENTREFLFSVRCKKNNNDME